MKPVQYANMSVFGYVFWFIVWGIPVIGPILMIFSAIADRNDDRKKFARIMLVIDIIFAVIGIALEVVLPLLLVFLESYLSEGNGGELPGTDSLPEETFTLVKNFILKHF